MSKSKKKKTEDIIINIDICEGLQVKTSVNQVTSERMNPRLWQWSFLGLSQILKHVKKFVTKMQDGECKSILDVGCGVKPYIDLFDFADNYVGLDVVDHELIDVVGKNWDMPFEDNEFDAIISTQVLEHTKKIDETIAEMRRVVRPGGLLFISLPFVFPEHEIPADYYRFTRYGLKEKFKDFDIIEIVPLNGYISTLVQMFNNLLHYIPGSKYFLFPIFFFNNIGALICDKLVYFFLKAFDSLNKKGPYEEVYDKYYMGFSENYVIVLKNTK